MGLAVTSGQVFRFGLFEADVTRNTLTRSGVRVKIQDQPFRVLILLLERPGEIVAREELRQKLWLEGTFVDFEGSLNVILKKLRAALNDDSDNPRFIETVHRRGYRFIAPVALGRTTDALTVAAAPVHEPIPEQFELPRTGRMLGLRHVVFAVVLISVAGAIWFSWHKRQSVGKGLNVPLSVDAKVPKRRSVAVLGFNNVSGKPEDAWLSTAFSEILSTELSAGQKLRLVSGEEVANLRVSSPWLQRDTLSQATAGRIGRALNSDLLVLGSYTSVTAPNGGQLRLDVRLQDSRNGEILAEVGDAGDRQDILGLASRIGARLRDRLGIPSDPDRGAVLASLPMNREAARFYALGVDKVRQFDALGAKDLLQQACIADPKFALGHMMLARAWHQLGYEQKRRHEAKQALDLSAHLPREDRLQVEGEYYESLPDHEKAASAYHALFELFPDDAEFGLELATSQKDAAHAGQAMETLHQLRQLPAPASDDPRIDLIELRAIPNNNPLALTMVQNAERKALAQAKRLLYAQARKEECMLHIYGEDPGLGPPACEEAYNIFMAVGNRLQAADALRLLADRQGGQGNSEAALATYKKALSLLQQLGETEKTGVVLNNMAIILTNEGKLDEAEQLYRQAKADFVRAGDKYAMTDALVNIADIYYERGNLGKAEQEYNQTLAAISQLENGAPGYAAMRLADVELARGQLLEAKNHAQQAVDSIHPPQGGQVYRSEAMVELGCILEAEANFEGARQLFQSAREIVEKLGQPDGVQEAQLAMASLALDERRPEQAEPLLRTAIAQFEKNKETPESASAYTELSRALLMEHRIDEAHDAIEHADELARTSPDPALKLPITIQTARVEMTEGGSHAADAQTFNRARRRLQSAAMTAKKLGYYLLECEARLALGELEMKTASPAAHSHLAALATETHSHGLELLAHQAEAIAANQQQLALNDQR